MHKCICTFAPSTSKDKETISDNITLYTAKLSIGQPMMYHLDPPGVVAIYL